MTRIVVLKNASLDFKELRSDFKAHHTVAAYDSFKLAFKLLFDDLKAFPHSGVQVEEAMAVGLDIRQRICEQIRVVYRYDKTADIAYLHLFLPTRRNFIALLMARILRPDF